MREHKEVAILLRIRSDSMMPIEDLIEYVRRCLKNGGIDLSLVSIDHAIPLSSDKNEQGAKKNIDNDRASHQNPTTITQKNIPI